MDHFLAPPILIDIETVQRAVGSQDKKLAAKIIANLMYEDEDEVEISWDEAIRRLIMGEADDSGPHVNALQLICESLGSQIWPDWDRIHEAAFDLVGLDVIMDRGAPVALPLRTNGPQVGYLTAAEVTERCNRAAWPSDPDHEEWIDEYRSWLEAAASRGVGIIFFA